jgi:hypothetical protein
MYKIKGSFLLRLLIVAALMGIGSAQIAWSKDKGAASSKPANAGSGQEATLKDVQKQVAAIRKNKRQMRSTTNDDRWAAATRHSSRHAAAVAKGEGRGK